MSLVELSYNNTLFRRIIFIIVSAFAFQVQATSNSVFFCREVFSSEITKEVRRRIGVISNHGTSQTTLKYPLVPHSAKVRLFSQVENAFGGESGFPHAKFFSQFHITEAGILKTIVDPTVKKNLGTELALKLSQNSEMRRDLQRVYENIQQLSHELRFALAETEIELAEVVLTIQINKASENWHIDWYQQEYLVATQTFTAKKRNNEGFLENEPEAGTEYLIAGDHPEVGTAILNERPKQIEFSVNTKTPVTLAGKGVIYKTPTNALSIHSGVTRIHKHPDFSTEIVGYSLVSPPHRGSYKDLVYRASLAIRFKPKK